MNLVEALLFVAGVFALTMCFLAFIVWLSKPEK